MLRLALVLFAALLCSCGRSDAPYVEASSLIHPLDPLTAGEIRRTVDILQADTRFGPHTRFAMIDLLEPEKQQVREDLRSGTFRRAARALFYNWETHQASDAVVDLGSGDIRSWVDLEGEQPPIRRLVISRLNEVVKADPRWQAAVTKFGVEDERINLLGAFTEDSPLDRRDGDFIIRAAPFMMDEGYQSMYLPVAFNVNLSKGEVISTIDRGGNWKPSDRTLPDWGRASRKPLNITQPQGTSYRINGSQVEWRNWTFHYAVHPRRGLELYDISYQDRGEQRGILYRASVSETLTPYGDPDFQVWYPLDEGDYGFGIHGIRSIVPGNDVPANAVFRDALLQDHRGNPYQVERAVGFYERDGGVLWRHAEESVRARDLVVTFVSTIDNYDYVFNWIFKEDGVMDVEVELSGIINYGRTQNATEREPIQSSRRRYNAMVAPGINGPNHQHFFAYRLDFDIDGAGANAILEANTQSDPVGPDNPQGHWFAIEESVLAGELQARRMVNPATARSWRIFNRERRNAVGDYTAYSLMPGRNTGIAAAPASPSRQKMGFVNHHLWVTPYRSDEVYAGGTYLQPGVRNQGLPEWTAQDRSIDNTDLVVWYVLGLTHQVRPEDFPLMPVHTAGFSLWPFGFFSTNPALDVAQDAVSTKE